MADITDTTTLGRRVFLGFLDGHIFEVYKDQDLGFCGLCDGVKTVGGGNEAIVLHGLQRKHIRGLPAGELVNLAQHREPANAG